ncbi:hypothetical protein C8Q80DRAFT_1101544, partial [Daedaleopsis nitida]
VDYRAIVRTPSPTPSEDAALKGKVRSCGNFDLKKYTSSEWLKNPRNLFMLVATLLIVGLLIAFVALQNKILDAISPAADWLRETPGAWLIPIAIMIVLSFPPLFGHELVAILCGDVWGVWIGFGIVAAGTIVGELATYYTFRYGCKARASKMGEKSLTYALISEVIREGGLKIAVIIRYSTIPPHLTTAVFATAGMSVWTFLIAAFVALPKQLAVVYIGPGLLDKKVSKTTTIIKAVVITATIIITIYAMRYVDAQLNAVKERVIYARRKARQAKLAGSGSGVFAHSPTQSSASDVGMLAGGRPEYAPAPGEWSGPTSSLSCVLIDITSGPSRAQRVPQGPVTMSHSTPGDFA